MKKLLFSLAAIVGIGFAMTATASNALSYNYVEGGYAYTHSVAPHNGLGVQASADVWNNVFVVGSTTSEFSKTLHSNQTELGVGYHMNIAKNVSAFGTLSGVVQYGNTPTSRTFYGADAQVGLRVLVLPKVEAFGSAEYEHLNQFSSLANPNEVYGNLGVRYLLTNNVSLVAQTRFSGQQKEALVGARFEW